MSPGLDPQAQERVVDQRHLPASRSQDERAGREVTGGEVGAVEAVARRVQQGQHPVAVPRLGLVGGFVQPQRGAEGVSIHPGVSPVAGRGATGFE